jgi:hypothetical protein
MQEVRTSDKRLSSYKEIRFEKKKHEMSLSWPSFLRIEHLFLYINLGVTTSIKPKIVDLNNFDVFAEAEPTSKMVCV